MTVRSAGRLVLCLLLCVSVGVLGSIFTQPEIAGWYATLAKPFWTPPAFVFPIVWTTLYILMGVCLWRLWDRGSRSGWQTKALALFAVQLVLNAIWSPIFFGWHNVGAALGVIVLLIVAIVLTIFASARVDRLAAWLLAPYLVWVLYASTLNAGIWAMN